MCHMKSAGVHGARAAGGRTASTAISTKAIRRPSLSSSARQISLGTSARTTAVSHVTGQMT